MARYITLSRAARLVGVNRATLQKQIRAGDLSTFEGELDLTELMRVYPQTKLEDSAMIERSDRLIERALNRVVRDQEGLPDAEVLATRIAALSHELGTANFRMRRYDLFMQQLQDYLRKLAEPDVKLAQTDINALRTWLDDSLQQLHSRIDDEGEFYATDMLLRVMAAQVHLEPSGHEFIVHGNDSLLDSGLRSGLALDYGCADGSCGRCVAKLKSGTLKLVRKPRYRLDEAERSQGMTLMCCHTAVTDVVIEAVETPLPEQIELQQLQARVGSVERAEDDIAILSLRPADGARLRFFAGQSVNLSSGGLSAEYPIASCPCDEHQLEFHIRTRDSDSFAQKLFSGMGLNQHMQVEGPRGDFVLDLDSLKPAIFLAWDTSFAPIKSLIEHAMALESAESLHLFWVHTEGELPYMHNRCRAWADALEVFHYAHMRVEPHVYRNDADARDTLATVLAAVAEPHFDVAAFDFYIAAPRTILDQCERYFTARGVPLAQLRMLEMAV